MPSSTQISRKPLSKLLLQLALILFAGFTMLGATDPSTRYDHLGHELMCTCGCGEILLECNHVGCPVSGPMTMELHNQLATALPNTGILDWFVAKYGPTVLAAPIRGGFDLVAWIMPFAMLGLGIAAVIFFLRLWRRRHAAALPATANAALPNHLRDRIRHDTSYDL